MQPILSNHQGLIDLHMHTTCSDGTLTPQQVVRRARSLGVRTIAVTDHDSMEGVELARETGIEEDVQVLPGVEISAHDEDREVHVLAFGLELHRSTELATLLADLRDSRRNRLLAMIERLRDQGIDLDPTDVLPGGSTAPARPHLAKALIDGGHARSIRDVFDRLIGPHCEAYVAKQPLSIAEAARYVHDAGGVAILAHPGRRYRDAKLLEFIGMGLDGIEVYHARQARRISKRLRAFAMEHDLLITGGSDFHGDGYPTSEIGESTQPRHDFEALLEELTRRSAGASPARTDPAPLDPSGHDATKPDNAAGAA